MNASNAQIHVPNSSKIWSRASTAGQLGSVCLRSFAQCCLDVAKTLRWEAIWKGDSRRLVILLLFILLLGPASNSFAQIRDGFETGSPRLQLWRSDATAQVTSHELISTLPYSGQTSEAIEVNCLGGSFIHLIYPIRPAALIQELQGRAQMRAAPRGLRIGLRVILPRSINPVSGTPANIVIFGSSNAGRGQWSEVVIDNVIAKFEEQLRVLNHELGYSVDSTNAFVDAVVFDVYNGPGATRLQIDDLALDGLVDPGLPVSMFPTQTNLESSKPEASLDVPTQVIRFQKTLPRLLQYQGESLDWLASLGFTGILSENEVDPLLVEQSKRTRLQLIAPMSPASLNAANDDGSAISVWNLSSAAKLEDLDRTRQAAVEVNRLPAEHHHPRFVEAMESHALYSRIAEVVAFPIPLPTWINSNQQLVQMVSEQLLQAGPRAMPIASLVIEPPQAWVAQCQSIQRELEQQGRYFGNDAEILGNVQLRQTLAHAMGLGFRGVLFRSIAPLDSGREVDMARSRTLVALNAELELLKPWLENGQLPQPISAISNSLFTGKSISTERSSLLMFVTQGEFDQIAPVSPMDTSLEFVIPRRNGGEQAYRITQGRLESLPLAPRTDGWGVRVASPTMVEQIVITNDQVVLQYLQRALPNYANAITSHRLETASNHLLLAQNSLHHENVPQNNPWWSKVQRAEALLRSASTNQAQGNLPETLRDSDQCLNQCMDVLRSSWLRASANYQDARSSPFLTNLSSLPLQWQLDRLLQGRTWESHPIPGSDFANLQQMTDLGWSHSRRMVERVDHQFAVASQMGTQQSTAMLLSAISRGGERIPGGFAGSTMRVRSADLVSYPGRVIRLRGKVRMDRPSTEPLSGVLLYDTFGWDSLGQPLAASPNTTGQWQSFELYRIVNSELPLRLYVEVRGEVSAAIDDLTLESITLTASKTNLVTVPVSASDVVVPTAP